MNKGWWQQLKSGEAPKRGVMVRVEKISDHEERIWGESFSDYEAESTNYFSDD